VRSTTQLRQPTTDNFTSAPQRVEVRHGHLAGEDERHRTGEEAEDEQDAAGDFEHAADADLRQQRRHRIVRRHAHQPGEQLHRADGMNSTPQTMRRMLRSWGAQENQAFIRRAVPGVAGFADGAHALFNSPVGSASSPARSTSRIPATRRTAIVLSTPSRRCAF
jgi:hypothetical protein